jgi:putative protease
VFLAINTYPQPDTWERWTSAIDQAGALGADAVIVADLGLIQYAAQKHPTLGLHLSVQGSATTYEAINFYARRFNVVRAVLPRVLTLSQVEALIGQCDAEIEVFGFGSLCVMVEGRCALSSYVTGHGPTLHGACSPANAVRWQQTAAGMESRLSGVLVNRFGPGEKAGYPTLCKGRYRVRSATGYAIEEPSSLNTLEILPALMDMGVAAIKIEGRQRSPAYVAEVTRVFRAAIDDCERSRSGYRVGSAWMDPLNRCAEGQQVTLGAYHRPWR